MNINSRLVESISLWMSAFMRAKLSTPLSEVMIGLFTLMTSGSFFHNRMLANKDAIGVIRGAVRLTNSSNYDSK